jgi:hypothetical protein
MMHAIARELAETCDVAFTPYFADGVLDGLARARLLDFTILGPGSAFRRATDAYLERHRLPVDARGASGGWDLALTCSDLVVPRLLRRTPFVLVQEGMTDPEDAMYHLVRAVKLPRWMASTSTTGLSFAYERFCVASEGYRAFFERKGVPASKLAVTGIPNFDDCRRYLENDFPLRGYVLAATSDARETMKGDDRVAFIRRVGEIAAGRPILFKLHPNEDAARATREVQRWAPGARVFAEGDVNAMVANCEVLVTQWSSVVYVGLALGKECHSAFDISELRRLLPLQNGGASARAIARVCEELLGMPRQILARSA